MLKRSVKRRTQALDTMRKAYIIDVESLKNTLRDQVCGARTDLSRRRRQWFCDTGSSLLHWTTSQSFANYALQRSVMIRCLGVY